MKVNFKQPRSIGGVDYRKGIHEVPDSFSGHWYLLACIQNGSALIVEAPSAKSAIPVKIQIEDSKQEVKTYHDHMESWESKDEVRQKSQKRIEAGKRAAETRAKKKAASKKDGE